MPAEVNTSRKDLPETPSLAYECMAEDWEMLHDLLGGTRTMREAGERWLPREPAEDENSYKLRLRRSFLLNSYGDTVDRLSNAPFSQPIKTENLPTPLEYLIENVDGTGRSLMSLAKSMLREMLIYGKTHVFVDYTSLPKNASGETMSKEEETLAGARATFCCVKVPDLFAWISTNDSQIQKLKSVRFHYRVLVQKGNFLDEYQDYIKEVTDTNWRIFERKEVNGVPTYVETSSGTITLGHLPLVTAYASEEGFMLGCPPLIDLAWLNVCHWQSSSDQRNILRLSRFAILFQRGVTTDELEKALVIGPSRLVRSKNDQGDLKYVEHTGKAIEAGAKDIQELEGQMDSLGKQPTVKGGRIRTATEVANNASRTLTELQTWIREVETALRRCFELAAAWHRIELPENFKIEIFDDFDVSIFGDGDNDWLLKAWMARLISQETAIKEAQRRGTLSEAVIPADEVSLTSDDLDTPETEDDQEEPDEKEDESEGATS